MPLAAGPPQRSLGRRLLRSVGELLGITLPSVALSEFALRAFLGVYPLTTEASSGSPTHAGAGRTGRTPRTSS